MTTFEDQLAPLVPRVDHGSAMMTEHWLEISAWTPSTVGAVFAQTARELPSKTAIVDGERRLTYAELDVRSEAAARHMTSTIGLKRGDRVLVQIGTSSSAVIALLAMFRAGIVPVCTVPRYRIYEMGALAALSGAAAHIVEPGAAGPEDLLALSHQLRAAHPALRWTMVTGHDVVGDAVSVEPPEEAAYLTALVDPSPLDVVAFQLSGGTTGVPKIIPRFHAEYLGYARAWSDRLALGGADVILWSLPITHNAGMLCFLLPTIINGATLVLQSRFDAEEFLETIERERVTVTGSIGPIAPRLLDVGDAADRFDLSSLRLFVTLHRAQELESHLRVPALGIYGITEGLLMASPPDAPADARHQTIGFPVSPHDEVVLQVPGEDRVAADGAVGELCFRGPSTLRSYYGNADATEAAFNPDRFFRSGDLVKPHDFDGHRYFSFEGRVKDNIDRGGEKFGTEEIEILLATHPAILSAVVVGMPDPYLGERVCAFVIPRRGVDAPSVPDVASYLLERGLAKFKCPERIEVVSELPETGVGKLDRPALRRRIAEILSTEEGT